MEKQTYEKQNYIELKTSPNLKGEIGEIIAQKIIWYAHRTKFNTFEYFTQYFMQKQNYKFTPEQYNFLEKYWNTIDLFKLVLDTNNDITIINNIVKNLVILEVKTCNYYPDREKIKHPFMPLTSRTYEMMMEAQKLGFITKFVKITFFENWRIGIKVNDFSMKDFYIHNGGTYSSYVK